MAGKKNGASDRISKSRGLLVSKKDANNAVVLANAPPVVRDALEQSCKEQKKTEKAIEREKTRYEKLLDRNKKYASAETQIEVYGGLMGQGFNEGLNYLLRMVAEWSQDAKGDEGFFASNIDWIQSFPGALGSLVFILEKALRPDVDPADLALPKDEQRPYDAPAWRRTVSEAAKVATHLGLSNTVRALRFRWAESIDERKETEARTNMLSGRLKETQSALEAATAELEKVKAQLQSLTPNGGRGGGVR